MEEQQARTRRTCRMQRRHRARDISVVWPMFEISSASRVEPARRRTRRAGERRSSARVHATGTAFVHGSFAVHARILDLAIGGVSLLVAEPAALPDVGAHVQLDVRLDGPGRWLHLSGSVVRASACESGTALAIELLFVPPDFEDLVQDELLSALECAQLPRILLVDAERQRRELVAAAFRATGCFVIEASTPLEAIAEIDQSRLHFWAVVIADSKIASHAAELRRFLGERYPQVPLIDVGRRDRFPGTTSLRIDGVPDLARQIFNLVGLPGQLGAP